MVVQKNTKIKTIVIIIVRKQIKHLLQINISFWQVNDIFLFVYYTRLLFRTQNQSNKVYSLSTKCIHFV